MSDADKKYLLEKTTEVEDGDAKIGIFNLIVYAVIIIICIAYLFLYFRP